MYLVTRKRTTPAILGMHPLTDGSGLVVRAFLPQAGKVEVHPLGEKGPPSFELQRIHQKDGVFEGVTKATGQIYPYELVVTAGAVQRQRDPYSFLPTLSEEDLYLLGKGDERWLYEKLGAQLRTVEGVAGTGFSVWVPNAQRISVVGDFNGCGRKSEVESNTSSDAKFKARELNRRALPLNQWCENDNQINSQPYA